MNASPTLSLDMIWGAVPDTQCIQVGSTTYNYLNQAALTLAAVKTTAIYHQSKLVALLQSPTKGDVMYSEVYRTAQS